MGISRRQFVWGVFGLAVVLAGGLGWALRYTTAPNRVAPMVVPSASTVSLEVVPEQSFTAPPPLPPPPISLERMKTRGCVADGLLSGYNPEHEAYVALVKRLPCYYLHRAIETWLTPPDFALAERGMAEIGRSDVIYGMFIAEAIPTHPNYVNVDTGEEFDFTKMCRKGTRNRWGKQSCIPNFSREEYRAYVSYITHHAIDSGIRSFTFGQIYLQEGGNRSYAREIVGDIRAYAEERGTSVVIGAQTGSIADFEYLKIFDFIEGGVGIDASGAVEDGPCLSTRGDCWALLWHERFATRANNVLLNLDWSGIPSDDLDIFTRMSPEDRARTLERLYRTFTQQDVGFMLPLFGVLDPQNGGCRGPKKKFYSPDNQYSCKDEDTIANILSRAR